MDLQIKFFFLFWSDFWDLIVSFWINNIMFHNDKYYWVYSIFHSWTNFNSIKFFFFFLLIRDDSYNWLNESIFNWKLLYKYNNPNESKPNQRVIFETLLWCVRVSTKIHILKPQKKILSQLTIYWVTTYEGN